MRDLTDQRRGLVRQGGKRESADEEKGVWDHEKGNCGHGRKGKGNGGGMQTRDLTTRVKTRQAGGKGRERGRRRGDRKCGGTLVGGGREEKKSIANQTTPNNNTKKIP